MVQLRHVVVVSSTPAGVGVVGTLQETETSVSNREAPAARHLAGECKEFRSTFLQTIQ